jgi:uncharacterized delta-60 repeat protein
MNQPSDRRVVSFPKWIHGALVLFAVSLGTRAAEAATGVDTFNPSVAGGAVRAIALQPDGKILIGGSFTSVRNQSRTGIARLHPDGGLDLSFSNSPDARVLAMAVQPDGKILIGGGFTRLGSQSRPYLARLETNGAVDTSFTGVADDWVWDLALLANGQVMVAGAFTNIGPIGSLQLRRNLARLGPTGALDTSFNSRPNDQVNTMAVQPDGRVVVGGLFTTLNGGAVTRSYLARLNLDGSLDGTFPADASGVVWRLAQQPDGKIVVGGAFGTLAGQPRARLGRLTADGVLDDDFLSGAGADSTVNSLALQADGKILAGGNFLNLSGQPHSHIGRFQTNGSVDATFTANADAILYSLRVQPDGKVLAGGDFLNFGGQARTNFARTAESLQITVQPASRRSLLGTTGVLQATVIGTAPIAYQWLKDGTNVPGATSAALTIPGLQGGHAGSYSLLVSNAWGGLASAEATLSVLKVANDDFANAFTLSGLPASGVADNTGATDEVGEPFSNSTSYSNSVWWKWTAPVTGTVTVDTTDGLIYGDIPFYQRRPFASVYVGESVEQLTPIPLSGDTFGYNRFSAVAATTYRIQVVSGPGPFAVVLWPPPVNDHFTNRLSISGAAAYVTGHNLGATREDNEPNHAGAAAGNSVWWTWRAPASGTVTLDTTGSSIDTALAVYRGDSLNNLALVASNRYSMRFEYGGKSRISFPAAANVDYQIAVDAVTGGSRRAGSIVLALRSGRAAANDAFVDRYFIPDGTSTVMGSNVGATGEAGDFALGGAGRTVWWTWIAPSNGNVTVDTSGSGFATRAGVFTGDSLDSLIPMVSPAATVRFIAVAGTAYQIAVDGTIDGESGNIVLSVTYDRLLNDHFTDRTTVTGSVFTVTGRNEAATADPGEPTHDGWDPHKSLWWSWTAPSSGFVTLDVSADFDAIVAVYTDAATLAGLQNWSSGSFTGGSGEIQFFVDAGVRYAIALDGIQGASGTARLTWRLPMVVANPDRASATPLAAVPGSFSGLNSGWWRFVASVTGSAAIYNQGASMLLEVLQEVPPGGATLVADNRRPGGSGGVFVGCYVNFFMQAGAVYYIHVTDSLQLPFELTLVADQTSAPFAAATNDFFASRTRISGASYHVLTTDVGATTEEGEPADLNNSLWWSWTAPSSRPVVFTTFGSSVDTFLAIYTGSTLADLSLVACNDDALIQPAQASPISDPISRVRLNPVAGTTYQIALSLARGNVGQVALNMEPLAVEDVVSVQSSQRPDRSVDFAGTVRVSNFRANATGPLRLRLVGRAAFSFLNSLELSCEDVPVANVPDEPLGLFNLPAALGSMASASVDVSGLCPPPYEAGPWGYGWGVLCAVEEQVGEEWSPLDSRLLLVANWPRINRFVAGGGVIMLTSRLGGAARPPASLTVSVGPPAAVALGGGWRVSPTNSGEVHELQAYTTRFRPDTVKMTVYSTNFTIETQPLPGFFSPANQHLSLTSGVPAVLDLRYSVFPPRLIQDPVRGLGLTGTVRTAYRIETSPQLPFQAGSALPNAVTLSAGTNWISGTVPPTNANLLYRALWLSQ